MAAIYAVGDEKTTGKRELSTTPRMVKKQATSH